MSDSAAVTAPPSPASAPDRREGWLTRWYTTDPVRAAAYGLIVVHLAVRAGVASGGYLVSDDFSLASRAVELGLWPDLLTGAHHNRLMPATMFLTWLVTTRWGLSYPAYLVAMLAGQAVLAVAFHRLLRLILPATWGVLIPLSVFLFSPLTLESTTWWAVGGSQLGMLLATVLALGAQVGYARTGRSRHLVALGGSFVLGLLFSEKSLVIAPLVLLWTACLLVEGGPVRSVVETVRRFWRSWAVLGALAGCHAALYAWVTSSGAREPVGAGETAAFVRETVGAALVPGFFGGPWTWLDVGDGPPVPATPEVLRWAAWIAFLALVVVTVGRRRTAGRAWLLLGLYLALTAALLANTRLGTVDGAVAGLAPRHVTDVVLVGALCVGVALFGLAPAVHPAPTSPVPTSPVPTSPAPTGPPLTAPPPTGPPPTAPARPGPSRHAAALGLVAALVLLVGSAGWTSARYGDVWKHKAGRDYLTTVRAELAGAARDEVFFDAPVPAAIMPAGAAPYNLQSRVFQHLNPRPQFVTAAEDPRMFDDSGHIRKARVDGTLSLPGPDQGCGYRGVEGRAARVDLERAVRGGRWVVRIGYLASGDSHAIVHFGGTTSRFRIRYGLNQILLVIQGAGEYVDVTALDPFVTVCVGDITVGTARPTT